MNSLTDNDLASVSLGDGRDSGRGPAVLASLLEVPVEWTEFCFVRNAERRVVAEWDCYEGFLACCTGCGDERIVPFTRAISEVA